MQRQDSQCSRASGSALMTHILKPSVGLFVSGGRRGSWGEVGRYSCPSAVKHLEKGKKDTVGTCPRVYVQPRSKRRVSGLAVAPSPPRQAANHDLTSAEALLQQHSLLHLLSTVSTSILKRTSPAPAAPELYCTYLVKYVECVLENIRSRLIQN